MIYIVGIGIGGKSSLSKGALKLIEKASLLVGGKRHLTHFPDFKGRKVVIGSNLDEIVRAIKNSSQFTVHSSRNVIVLASGDPNLFGIADFLIKRLGEDTIEIIPNVSVMQEAFAKIKEDWGDARFLSVHGKGRGQGSEVRGQGKDIVDYIADEIIRHKKVGIFTDPVNTPSKIAKALLDKGIKDYKAYVCEDLGTEREKTTVGTLARIAKKRFSPLNVMILIRQWPVVSGQWSVAREMANGKGQRAKGNDSMPHAPCPMPSTHHSPLTTHHYFGIPDSEFSHPRGMITKEEVRVLSLSKLRLENTSVLWDIGAGCGSLSIEAAIVARDGWIYAVEKDKRMVGHIERNKKRFGVTNIDTIHKEASVGLKGLPLPDRIFIGGGGIRMPEIMRLCSKRLKGGGRIVVNAVTMETMLTVSDYFKRAGWRWGSIAVNIARTKDVADIHLFNAHNPVFIIVGEKP